MENEIQYLMERYPELDPDLIRYLVQSGLDEGISIRAAVTGVRMALAEATGRQELFNLDDVAALIDGTREEAAALMKEKGVTGMKVSTIPGLEWVLKG